MPLDRISIHLSHLKSGAAPIDNEILVRAAGVKGENDQRSRREGETPRSADQIIEQVEQETNLPSSP